jgi:hypothetical protein
MQMQLVPLGNRYNGSGSRGEDKKGKMTPRTKPANKNPRKEERDWRHKLVEASNELLVGGTGAKAAVSTKSITKRAKVAKVEALEKMMERISERLSSANGKMNGRGGGGVAEQNAEAAALVAKMKRAQRKKREKRIERKVQQEQEQLKRLNRKRVRQKEKEEKEENEEKQEATTATATGTARTKEKEKAHLREEMRRISSTLGLGGYSKAEQRHEEQETKAHLEAAKEAKEAKIRLANALNKKLGLAKKYDLESEAMIRREKRREERRAKETKRREEEEKTKEKKEALEQAQQELLEMSQARHRRERHKVSRRQACYCARRRRERHKITVMHNHSMREHIHTICANC